MAKFKVGDRCIHTDIMGHMDKCIVTKADKPGRYTVEFYLGGEKEVAESSLRKLTNAVRNGYVPLRTKSGGVERVYDGDRVIYKGKEFTAEKLGSPSLAQGILVGDDGAKVTVSLKDPDLFATNAVCACNSTNAIVRKAMNATALNYSPYAKGAWIHDDKGRNYTVVEDEHWGKDGKAVRLVTIRDEQTKQTKEVPTTELSYRFHMGEAESCRKCGNAALNFSPGDKVSIIDTDIRYGGDKGEVVRKDGFRYVVRLTSRQDKPEVYFQPNQLKAANAEDAQGHEHGSDGKFTSKGGGSDGGDSYEDPKTKRMKERLAKMREKNEALRKEIDQRKAALAGKKAETEKMREDVMKANVEKWKAGLPKTKNTIVEKAINAVAKNADEYVIRKAFTPGKWLLERKTKSLGDAGSVKAFSSEDEARAYAKSKGLSVVNAVAKNDKWIDDFHVIVTGGTPDKELVDALKKKAAAWKAAKRNFSDTAAGAAHDKAESDAMAVAKRLGARWVQQGAVLKVIMPNAVARNDWVADRTGDYTWRETAKERGIKSALRAAGASYANYIPVNRGSVERMNYDSLSWVVRADESVIDKVAQKMKQLGMEEVSKPTWYQYDEFTVVGYTKIKPMPKNAVAKNSVSSDKIDQADIKILRDGGMSETDIVEAVRLWPMKEAKWGGLKTLAQFVSGSKAKDLLMRHHEWAQSAYEVNSSDTSLIDRTFGVTSTKTGKTTIGFKDPKTNLEVVVTKGPMWWMIKRSDGKKMKSVQNPAEWARKKFV